MMLQTLTTKRSKNSIQNSMETGFPDENPETLYAVNIKDEAAEHVKQLERGKHYGR